ncbi:helix-turn-helix domain-containing protein [Novosphingobium profundi]|uniref:helix-turn-helix domain-containing protein n=1 Tax=Novosphingobium profundi TaxID=1774954 RepID=UPI001BDA35F8|nr:helix-turn-helix domain-containing protein [Novosphingobium profundi]MBT0668183.1 helix-turn-helix domain-containing protein [Novosphingobium profundi]
MTPSTIPTFLLYGEDPGDAPAQFGHIETIAARSSLLDWEIGAHRHLHSVQILLVSHGQVSFRCDGRAEDLSGPCFMAIPIGSVHGFHFQPETRGFVLSLSGGFLARGTSPEDPLRRMLTLGASGSIAASATERVDWLCREMLALQTDWRSPSALFLALAEALVRSLEERGAAERPTLPDDARLAGFRRLIEQHLTEHRPVEWFAERLGVSGKTLTRICRRTLDCTPSDLIHARLLLEAQRLLCFTSASVVQVAEDLGFSDPSYFSRFYKRMSGHRPQQDKSGAALATAGDAATQPGVPDALKAST